MTFAANGGAAPLDCNTVFQVGDSIGITLAAGAGTVKYYVSRIINATSININSLTVVANVAAAQLDFSRYRTVVLDNNARNVTNFELIMATTT